MIKCIHQVQHKVNLSGWGEQCQDCLIQDLVVFGISNKQTNGWPNGPNPHLTAYCSNLLTLRHRMGPGRRALVGGDLVKKHLVRGRQRLPTTRRHGSRVLRGRPVLCHFLLINEIGLRRQWCCFGLQRKMTKSVSFIWQRIPIENVNCSSQCNEDYKQFPSVIHITLSLWWVGENRV